MEPNDHLVARSLRAVWHPCTQMKLHERFPMTPMARGQGVWLYDFAGNRYFDAISSWWVNLFGHSNPRINAAVKDQLDRLEHVMLGGFTHEPVVELSEQLSALTGNRLGHCFYASDGSAAIDIALKMSFHYWRESGRATKTKFLSLHNSYHGDSTGRNAARVEEDFAGECRSHRAALRNILLGELPRRAKSAWVRLRLGEIGCPKLRARAPG